MTALRWLNFVGLLLVAWCVMTFTHELGHLLGGWCCGGTLQRADLIPWHLPYSIFAPDPHPLITLWSGLLFGAIFPFAIAQFIRQNWMWFVASFCVLANGAYIATGWMTGERFLDTTKLLENGAHPLSLLTYCAVTIGFGYVGFRKACIQFFESAELADAPETRSENSTTNGIG